jgi:NADH:ubiquinone oxidoreductase subunit E
MESSKTIVSTNHYKKQECLIAILEDIQAKYSYLPKSELEKVANNTGRSMVDIYGVATFYRAFSLKQRGKHLVSVCQGTACHVRNAISVADEFSKQLKIKSGETTPDKEFTYETVNCLGACALGPVVVVDGHYYSGVSKVKVKSIIDKTLEGVDKIDIQTEQRIFPIEVSCSRCNHSMMSQNHLIDGYPSILITVSFGNKHGWLALSSLYGSYNVTSEYKIPLDTIVQIFCPHCHAELIGSSDCPLCGNKMVPLIVRGGGIIQICPKKGCKGHILDLSGTWIY